MREIHRLRFTGHLIDALDNNFNRLLNHGLVQFVYFRGQTECARMHGAEGVPGRATGQFPCLQFGEKCRRTHPGLRHSTPQWWQKIATKVDTPARHSGAFQLRSPRKLRHNPEPNISMAKILNDELFFPTYYTFTLPEFHVR